MKIDDRKIELIDAHIKKNLDKITRKIADNLFKKNNHNLCGLNELIKEKKP